MTQSSSGHDALDLVRKLTADLRHRAGEIEAIFEVLPVGIGIGDATCRDIRVNRAFAEQLGIDAGQNASLSAPEDVRPHFRVFQDGRELTADELPMQIAARTGVEIRDFEVDIVHADGRCVRLVEYAAPIFDDSGSVRGVVGAFVDMTERHRVEEEQRFLAEASRVLSSTLDYEATLSALAHLAVPVFGDYCAIDVQKQDGSFGRVEFVVNDPGRMEIGEALKRYPPRLTVDSPAAHAIRTGEPVLATEVQPDVLERSAQDSVHLDLLRRLGVTSYMMVPLRARGRTLGLLTTGSLSGRAYAERDLALASDVAARAGLALDNALLYRDAQEANRLKEDFLATLSHELRTPLNALLGWTHLLKGTSLDEASRRRALESIERNAHAQTVLINDLLDVSRVISGKLRLEEVRVNLESVIGGAVDAIGPAVRARGIDLSVALGPITVDIMGDPDRLQQVVWNLLSNAVKFTPSGGRIAVAIEQLAGAVQIVVSDTGAGIDPMFLPFVFERFRQGDSSTTRNHSGLGLGLSIVRHLVDLHGGTVTAESGGLGMGSRFTVTLPAGPHGVQAAGSERRAPEKTSLLGGIRVLAVDDDEDSRELILLTARGAGAEVMVVGSAASALEALDTFGPHVVVADIAMPAVDGYTLVREIRARQAPVPVIGLSAYASAADQRQAIEAGFARHLAKPADFDELVSAIAALARTEMQ